jgi:hypothetical protein
MLRWDHWVVAHSVSQWVALDPVAGSVWIGFAFYYASVSRQRFSHQRVSHQIVSRQMVLEQAFLQRVGISGRSALHGSFAPRAAQDV